MYAATAKGLSETAGKKSPQYGNKVEQWHFQVQFFYSSPFSLYAILFFVKKSNELGKLKGKSSVFGETDDHDETHILCAGRRLSIQALSRGPGAGLTGFARPD